jgi:Putative rhamnosyl transferase
MAVIRNQIVGLVRFSYPALSGFARKPDDPAALARRLHAPARLEARFRLFEALTLPSLLAQTDPAFQLGVLVGEGFPADARARLEALLAPLPGGARIVALPPMHHYPATQRALGKLTEGTASHLTSFRLDDDDAIDRGLVGRLRTQSAAMMRLVGDHRPFVLGHNRGFFLEIAPSGNRIFDVVEKLPLGIGLAMTAPVTSGENIFARNHRLLPQFYTTLTEADTPAFIRTVHAGNDSDAHASGVSGQMTDTAAAEAIEAGFPFRLADLLAL